MLSVRKFEPVLGVVLGSNVSDPTSLEARIFSSIFSPRASERYQYLAVGPIEQITLFMK